MVYLGCFQLFCRFLPFSSCGVSLPNLKAIESTLSNRMNVLYCQSIDAECRRRLVAVIVKSSEFGEFRLLTFFLFSHTQFHERSIECLECLRVCLSLAFAQTKEGKK